MNLTNKQKVDILGDIGEKLVINWFNSQGRHAQLSIDKFDSEKDFIFDYVKKGEIKTQALWKVEDAFSFRENQETKILNADSVFIVSSPSADRKYATKYEGYIYEFNPKEIRLVYGKKTFDGRPMILIPRRQAAMKIIHKVTAEELYQMGLYAS